MKHFNNLTPAEAERIALLMEECAEVIQICGKILRHGYESFNPMDSNRTTNRRVLEREVGHVRFAISLMTEEDRDLTDEGLDKSFYEKSINVWKYLHHNKDLNN
jgi:hypothetical protein